MQSIYMIFYFMNIIAYQQFFATVIKDTDKGNLKEKEFILPSREVQFMVVEETWQ